MKSSLKTFLAGQNPYSSSAVLKGATYLEDLVESARGMGCWIENSRYWNIDVLDDGTAITYSIAAYPADDL